MTQQLENIKTAIRVYSDFELRDVVSVTQSMMAHFPEDGEVSDAFLDFVGAIEKVIDSNAQDTRPADESWKPRQDTALFEAHPMFKEAFEALDNLRIRGAI